MLDFPSNHTLKVSYPVGASHTKLIHDTPAAYRRFLGGGTGPGVGVAVGVRVGVGVAVGVRVGVGDGVAVRVGVGVGDGLTTRMVSRAISCSWSRGSSETASSRTVANPGAHPRSVQSAGTRTPVTDRWASSAHDAPNGLVMRSFTSVSDGCTSVAYMVTVSPTTMLVEDALILPVGSGAGVGVGVRVGVDVRVGVGDAVGVFVGVGVRVGVALGVRVGVAVGVLVGVATGVGAGVAVAEIGGSLAKPCPQELLTAGSVWLLVKCGSPASGGCFRAASLSSSTISAGVWLGKR